MTTISTISELLSLSDSQYRIYDIGRRIDKISKADFNKIEANQLPYPFPSQGHAFVAIAFWQKKSPQPYLWFVKLPLDERGLLNLASRNHFIEVIITALGTDLSVDPTEKQEELLKSNPYHFTPSQYKLAFINSLLKAELKQPNSVYYQGVQNYLTEQKWDNWQTIGVQGITDLCARLALENNRELVSTAFEHLPEQVLLPVCSALENISLDVNLIDKIIAKYAVVEQNNLLLKTHLLRALASSCEHPHVMQFFDKLLQQSNLPEDIIIAIAARCWQVLHQPAYMMNYLENIAQGDASEIFSALFKDLVAIPLLRPILFQCMREPNRSDTLAKAIGLLFNQVGSKG
ncbi:DUF3549 family protein [Thalassotalea sp. PLHSN55]|uniref:DUF3549 family protein n=1 Tax=Thalassotalea sp. PLHSN55 TaxID=3435888 RepID=UPI003F84ABC8